MMKTFIHVVFALFIHQVLMAQNVVHRNDTIPVLQDNGFIDHPWAGGLNAPQTGVVDLNLDGIDDLIMLESSSESILSKGDKIITFINNGTSGQVDYEYAPEYEDQFPPLNYYALFRDYNCDGKQDIFAFDYRNFVTVYRNDSDTALKFTLVRTALTGFARGLHPSYGFTPEIYWNVEDMISVTDIDSDGDLDILTVDRSGEYIEYYKNRSMDSLGHCDSLIFELKSTCWGKVREDMNIHFLHTCGPYNVSSPERRKPNQLPQYQQPAVLNAASSGAKNKHSNTALLALDLDADDVMDLLTTDGIYTTMNMLMNGGKKDSAEMISHVGNYPPVNPVDIELYPLPFYEDMNNDGKKDLIIAPRYSFFKDFESVWWYEDTSLTASPAFALRTKSFLQEDMIDVGRDAYPVFFDYNNDSLMDMVIGNYGYLDSLRWPRDLYTSGLALYENTGTVIEPSFKLVTRDYSGISSVILDSANNLTGTGLCPTFGDLDGDGDEDMILGDLDGRLHYFENIPNAKNEAEFHLKKTKFQGILTAPNARPQLFDLDRDGKMDLIIGDQRGFLSYYRNTSASGNITFELEKDTLGMVDVRAGGYIYGYASPFFYNDTNNVARLLVGSQSGWIHYFDSIHDMNGELNEDFNHADYQYQGIWEGVYTSIHGYDFNNDKSMDLIIGNQSGGIALYTGNKDSVYVPPPPPPWIGVEEVGRGARLSFYPNPTSDLVYFNRVGDGGNTSFQLEVFDLLGHLVLQRNMTTQESISIASLPEGVYVMRMINPSINLMQTERLIKQ